MGTPENPQQPEQPGAEGAQQTNPPGWYPDPQVGGQQRYWDGTKWTDQIAGYTPAPTTPGARVPDSEGRQWAMFAHLSALVASVIGLTFVGPLVIYLAKKDDHPYILDQSREALNFNLSVLIYVIAAVISLFFLIGFLLLPGVIIAWLVLTIIAATKANKGEPYRYPLTIRMVT